MHIHALACLAQVAGYKTGTTYYTAVDNARVAEKADSRAYGLRVDAEAKVIVAQIQKMIEVHDAPIKLIEQKDKDRKTAIEKVYDFIVELSAVEIDGKSSARILEFISMHNDIVVDESFDEYMSEATRVFNSATMRFEVGLTVALQAEADQAELEKLRQEKLDDEKEKREAKIATDAAEAATKRIKEEADAKVAKAEKETKDAEAKAAKVIQEAKDAEAKSIQDKKDAEDLVEKNRLNEIKRLLQAQAAEKAAQAKREANTRNVGAVRKSAKEALMLHCNLSEAQAKSVGMAIHAGDIPHISIKY